MEERLDESFLSFYHTNSINTPKNLTDPFQYSMKDLYFTIEPK